MAKSKTKTITPFGPDKPVKIKKGALTAQAKRAGKSISEFCAGKHSGRTAKRCGLAKAFRTIRNR
jgi:hypothetical protein